MVLYSAVFSPLDRSKRFTLSSPGRPVHSDTVLGFSWKHSSHAPIAIDAAIVYNEGETDRVPIFSIPGLTTFMKLGVVKIGRNESQKLKSSLL